MKGQMIIGGFGNQLFQWAGGYARAMAAGEPFRVGKCHLDRVFELPPHETVEGNLEFMGYFQDQDSLLYTRSQVREWFLFKKRFEVQAHRTVAHVRRGDYLGAGYPVVTEKAFAAAAGDPELHFVGNENAGGPDHTLSFLPDFFTLMEARTLYRSNSSFSWWAHVLGENERVFSPRIDGFTGGEEYDEVPFEEGNHCRLSDLPMCTDLHLSP